MNQKLDLILPFGEPNVKFNICSENYILRNESKVVLDLILPLGEPNVGFNICTKNYILWNESKVGFNIGTKNWI